MNATIEAMSLVLPSTRRSNDYWRRRFPEMVRTQGDRVNARIWSAADTADDPWSQEMRRYTRDPFRGAVERRWLGPGESVLTMELRAAREAMAAAGREPGEIDLLVSASFQPQHWGHGDATLLARDLGLRGGAFNIESACSSALVALQTAWAHLAAGLYRTALVVVSCAYSRAESETDTMAWSIGDGASAFVLTTCAGDEGFQSFVNVHTGQTCGSMYYAPYENDAGVLDLRLRAAANANTALRDAANTAVAEHCPRAVAAAGLDMDDIDFLAAATPVAWYSAFARRVLGFTGRQTFNCHPMTANTGPVLMPTNLFHGALDGLLRPGDLVLLHTVGSVSSAGAAVLRWGEVALGPRPGPTTHGE